ncbi:MAG TPA: helix-turn-helix domain-containing GNAT family N-acetyltransferase [Gemmatimonadaceae bacterium]|nr:helix-turn-helix domain-containing GNAT family N-acetyltransferase [Gemmatimonadaceae bacterium]
MAAPSRDTVAAIRRFNRFYTRQIGILNAGFLDSPFSLTEVRLLYELSSKSSSTLTELSRNLGVDPGYVSRIARSFTSKGLIIRKRSTNDGRTTNLSLSAKGRTVFRDLDRRQQQQIEKLLSSVPPADESTLLTSLSSVERVLTHDNEKPPTDITLRDRRPGDIGWIIHRQAVLYHDEYGWNEQYEAIVAEILARFIEKFDPKRERSWIAERNGQVVGSIFCVRKSRTVAQLRLLYVEPSARGLGIGTQLVEECIEFARAKGYRRLVLWTNSVLHSARRIYEAAGFTLVDEETHDSFGKQRLVAQTWELSLD